MPIPTLLLQHRTPEVIRARLAAEFPGVRVVEARDKPAMEKHLPEATMVFGLPPADLLPQAKGLRWIQLASAGVPWPLCDALKERNLSPLPPSPIRRGGVGGEVVVTNLSGLYGPTIAEHTLALMLMVARNLHRALWQQQEKRWQRDIADHIVDLAGKTVAIVGMGNIGQNIARLCRGFGLRVVGCRRTPQATPFVDQLYPVAELKPMLSEAEFVVVAAPLTRESDGLLGPAEFAAMKKGAFYVNISRGPIAREDALLDALRSGHVAGAGLDVFAVEPLPVEHPLWTMPSVVVSPHYSGETVNRSSQPGELLLKNLREFLTGRPISKVVDLAKGY